MEGLLEWKRSRVRQRRQWLDYIRVSTGLSCALHYVKLGQGGRILSREFHGSEYLNHEGGCRMDGI